MRASARFVRLGFLFRPEAGQFPTRRPRRTLVLGAAAHERIVVRQPGRIGNAGNGHSPRRRVRAGRGQSNPCRRATPRWRSPGSSSSRPTDKRYPAIGASWAARRAVLCVRAQHPQDDLHHQRGRGAAPIAAQDHQNLRQLPQRRCGAEAALSRDQECRAALAAQHRVDRRDEPIRDPVRRALSGNHAMTITAIAAASMIAWSASSPSSPAPAARRCAALGLDRSMRPSKMAHRSVDAVFSMHQNENPSSQKSLTQNF